MSRTRNSLRNAAGSMFNQLVTALLRFACRTAFLYTLGQEYLGISSLYTNVITILNITELGFSTVITYSLYEPLARNDRETVRSLMAFFRKVYRVVGLGVLVLGLGLMPFLPKLMTGVTDKVDIYQYYLLYLAQTVVSYLFFAYKSVLLIADQKKYLVDIAAAVCHTVVCVAQILSLLVLRSFLVYTLLGIAQGIAQNVAAAVLTDKRYPYLKEPAKPLTGEQKKPLYAKVYAMFLQKVSTAVGTATDNLIISACVSVTAVGLYNNYYLIVSTVQSLLGNLFRALTASLGNLWATEDQKKSGFVFQSLNLANSFLVCLCGVCFLTMFRPFITIWAGESYLLDEMTVLVIVLNFATNYLQNVVQIYRTATGLFEVGKYRSVINAAMNLGLSLVFVRWWGMAGVFLGSIVSRLLTVWWFDGWVLCRRAFGTSPWGYYGSCVLSLAVMLASSAAACALCRGMEAGWTMLVIRGTAGCAVCTSVYVLLYGSSCQVRYLIEQFAHILGKKS